MRVPSTPVRQRVRDGNSPSPSSHGCCCNYSECVESRAGRVVTFGRRNTSRSTADLRSSRVRTRVSVSASSRSSWAQLRSVCAFWRARDSAACSACCTCASSSRMVSRKLASVAVCGATSILPSAVCLRAPRAADCIISLARVRTAVCLFLRSSPASLGYWRSARTRRNGATYHWLGKELGWATHCESPVVLTQGPSAAAGRPAGHSFCAAGQFCSPPHSGPAPSAA